MVPAASDLVGVPGDWPRLSSRDFRFGPILQFQAGFFGLIEGQSGPGPGSPVSGLAGRHQSLDRLAQVQSR